MRPPNPFPPSGSVGLWLLYHIYGYQARAWTGWLEKGTVQNCGSILFDCWSRGFSCQFSIPNLQIEVLRG
jgi:hypothetical protein